MPHFEDVLDALWWEKTAGKFIEVYVVRETRESASAYVSLQDAARDDWWADYDPESGETPEEFVERRYEDVLSEAHMGDYASLDACERIRAGLIDEAIDMSSYDNHMTWATDDIDILAQDVVTSEDIDKQSAIVW